MHTEPLVSALAPSLTVARQHQWALANGDCSKSYAHRSLHDTVWMTDIGHMRW
ncbi:hypothetical protein COCSUDRAFT_54997 [Coccomyxa subellipsoidea C-169]|uniref:Uncharacterized protein n=1 Tax=Coccomyxa subellipsoidea (strain C-169) TaxID=574566 RepID=I0YIT1_COCSC|nr:hypothetical protein COCSUDRAFT_54997 [Coccomyxa subellipsoidea C-169]EIE18300.1 hypothetical protein COCSUDRAFT_54997 [Coccomyxa subellipsoidea C-169]|eukprot:XP_005642844.1 hypothetical protein COCSUDRAFT_54997 [Coccomyxa subellipsoidea C-169]